MVSDDALSDLGSHVADLAGWIAGARVARARCSVLDGDVAAGELELDDGAGRVRFRRVPVSAVQGVGQLAGSATESAEAVGGATRSAAWVRGRTRKR